MSSNRVKMAVARSDGRASFRPYKNDWKTHVGDLVQVAGEWLRVSRDGRVHIPKRMMDAYGAQRADGRRAIGIQTGARSDGAGDDRYVTIGARLITPEGDELNLGTGELFPPEGFKKPSRRIQEPSDSTDYYFS